jgi:hydroxyacylglutathione hydrolase
MDQMHASLQKLGALPGDTRVYFGHEYTASNLKFAAHLDPDNIEVAARRKAIPSPSTPSTIALELATNPFLRARDAAEFAARRTAKDTFQ